MAPYYNVLSTDTGITGRISYTRAKATDHAAMRN